MVVDVVRSGRKEDTRVCGCYHDSPAELPMFKGRVVLCSFCVVGGGGKVVSASGFLS